MPFAGTFRDARANHLALKGHAMIDYPDEESLT
jgi:hypothetical protein